MSVAVDLCNNQQDTSEGVVMSIHRRTLLRGLAAGTAGVLAGPELARAAFAASPPEPTRDISYRGWSGIPGVARGARDGTGLGPGGLRIHRPIGTITYTDPFVGGSHDYEYATWTSPWVSLGFAASQAVSSWNASTPGGTWIQTELRGVTLAGTTTKWYVMGRWAADDAQFSRTSVPGQRDADGTVDIDTFEAADGGGMRAWQLRLTLYRPAGSRQTPTVRSAGAMASLLPDAADYPTSAPRLARGVALPVPRFSQDVHLDQYPQWDNGGEACCSPTSTSMVVAYWHTGPSPADYAWVDPSYADPWVDYAARNTYDNNYTGCGNWPFNTAYAARFGLRSFVTRMRSFNEVERFIAAGIPVVVSAAFKKGQVPGADYSTNGHLMVIAGFTADGDPVMNDPAAPDDPSVRKVFGRPEFENAWRNSSGGTVYIIHPATVALPPSPRQANW
jgi:hypothetical protein